MTDDQRTPWRRVKDLKTISEAREQASITAAELVGLGPVSEAVGDLEILEEMVIPPLYGDPNPFLSLHFDWGHPVFPLGVTPLYLALALYRPIGTPASGARTRLVSLPSLLYSESWGTRSNLEGRLSRYAETHGSSWDWDGDSGHRVSCFARIVDALNADGQRLTKFPEIPKDQWYEVSNAGHEFRSLKEELSFYDSCGLSLESEVHVELEEGELLVVDNVRAIHGRVGARTPGEVHQFLHGVRSADPPQSERIRHWLIDLFTEKPVA